jgi:hypothetical protein
MGFAPTGERRLYTAHTRGGHFRYLSRTHTMRLKSVLPGKMMLGAGADSMKSYWCEAVVVSNSLLRGHAAPACSHCRSAAAAHARRP